MESSYKPIQKITKAMKGKFPETYAQYKMTQLSQLLLPKQFCSQVLDDVSSRFTVAFSNTPGCVKSLYYTGLRGEKISSLWT